MPASLVMSVPQRDTITQEILANVSDLYCHEWAVQRWCHQNFHVVEGYPTPVVFTTPMDAYAYFSRLWALDNNPFKYLTDAKDPAGVPLYAPHPSPPRYPVIAVKRLSQEYATSRSYGLRRWRNIGWPTFDKSGSTLLGDMGNVLQTQMPTAWNFRYQLTHLARDPGTHGVFFAKMARAFNLAAGVPQTWIKVVYPGFVGVQLVRIYLDSNIEDSSDEVPAQEATREYLASAALVVEGYAPSMSYQMVPAFWNLVIGQQVVAPDDLASFYDFAENQFSRDLRPESTDEILNPLILERSPFPPVT